MREESFPIDEKTTLDYIKYNKKCWSEESDSKEYIYLNLSMVRMQAPWIIPKILFAKGIQKRTGAKIVALTWRRNKLLNSFFKSYGIDQIAIDDICKKSFISAIKALLKIMGVIITCRNGESVKGIKIANMQVGKDLYEDIIRTSNLSTIRTPRKAVVIKKLFHLFWSLYSLDRYIKKQTIKYAIVDDYAYHEGAFIKLFRNNGAKIIASNNTRSSIIEFDENNNIIRNPAIYNRMCKEKIREVGSDAVCWTDNCLDLRFKGQNGREIDRVAFFQKEVWTRKDFVNKIGIDDTKKTVVIMAHTFTDAVYNYGEYYFRDYYDWTERTLEIASMVDCVNWVLKPHPTRDAYNESKDSIELMFQRLKKDNMYILPDFVSGESIKNVADVIVTIGGNAGAEFACFGIPSVIVGKPYYSGFGYTIEPKSYLEYKEILKKAFDIEKLSCNQIELAKKVFFLFNNKESEVNKFDYKDHYATFINSLYNNMIDKIAIEYFKSNKDTESYNTDILIKWEEYTKKHSEKDSEYYLRGYNIDKLFAEEL